MAWCSHHFSPHKLTFSDTPLWSQRVIESCHIVTYCSIQLELPTSFESSSPPPRFVNRYMSSTLNIYRYLSSTLTMDRYTVCSPSWPCTDQCPSSWPCTDQYPSSWPCTDRCPLPWPWTDILYVLHPDHHPHQSKTSFVFLGGPYQFQTEVPYLFVKYE